MAFARYLLHPFITAFNHRHLIRRLTQHELAARTKSTLLGGVWLVISPLLLLGVYSFVFAMVFNARWKSPAGGEAPAVLILFSGLIVFGILSECINRAPGLVLESPAYVKKVVFPLEILPWVSLLSALVVFGINLALLLVAYAMFRGLPPVAVLLLPLALTPLILTTLGLSWFLASLGVFVRDIRQVTGLATTMLMFVAPVFYPLDSVPEGLRTWLYLNPVTLAVEQTRQVLFWGELPNVATFGVSLAAGWIIAALGHYWFIRTRKGFADVL
jgi:lipopolysaccharide transport system permease protein